MKRVNRDKRNKKILYSPWVVHQAILSGIHTSLTGVISSHLGCSIPTVSPWLLSFYFLRGLSLYFVFWRDVGNLLVFGSHNLRSLSALQKSGIFSQNFVPELFQVLQLFLLLLLLYESLLFSFLHCLVLSNLSCLLSNLLNVMDLCYLFQASLEPLLLFVPSLHFLTLLFKHLGISLENVRGNRRRHDNIEERQK